ncbi:hypothetical protein OQA88_8028 [Cercophora sp. LCS_1]
MDQQELAPPTLDEWLSKQTVGGLPITRAIFEDPTAQTRFETTVAILKKLFTVATPRALEILNEKTEIKRLWRPRTHPISADDEIASLRLHGFARVIGVALAIYEDRANTAPCDACARDTHSGPCDMCIVPAEMTEFGCGSCTNCYFRAQSTKCSFRLAREAEGNLPIDDKPNTSKATGNWTRGITDGWDDEEAEPLWVVRERRKSEEDDLMREVSKCLQKYDEEDEDWIDDDKSDKDTSWEGQEMLDEEGLQEISGREFRDHVSKST